VSVFAVRATYDGIVRGSWGLREIDSRMPRRQHARHGAYEVAVDDLDVTFFSERPNIMKTTYDIRTRSRRRPRICWHAS
jgi:hypothetical protein